MTTDANATIARSPERKLASKVAEQIIADITRHNLVVGTVIGSETDLLDRHQISRAVFRESVRLLEHLGMASTRRGPGGGLVVSAPSTAAVTQAFMVYLTYAGMKLDHLLEARQLLEGAIARLAAERADEDQIMAMRERLADDRIRESADTSEHHVLHVMIARSTGNPAAELFTDALGRLTARWAYQDRPAAEQQVALEATVRAHELIVDAIMSGDAAAAERRMSAHLAALGDWLNQQPFTLKSLDRALDAPNGEDKLGSQIARRIIVEIADGDWPIGDVVGSEADLLARYDVSRSALREAVRLLEYHEVAAMRRGPGGGLVVTSPSIDPIVRAATVFLEHRGITAGDLIVLRRDLESEAVALAAERATPSDIERLRTILDAEAATAFEGPLDEELHVNIAELTGNSAIALFLRILVELTRAHATIPGRRSSRRTKINSETEHAHHAIVEAIAAGDAALARRRVTKHLRAMEPLLH